MGARLGQHFLTDLRVLDTMLLATRLTKTDTVLEVGPGKGVLTEKLLTHAGKVIAIEKDSKLVGLLQKKFADDISSGRLELIEGDIRDMASRLKLIAYSYLVVANIPYYLTGTLIRGFLSSDTPPSQMILLVQQEVAERISKSQKESLLSLSVKAYGKPKYVATVPKNAFSPQPKVASAVLLIDSISRYFFTEVDERTFFEVLRLGFGKKRKQLFGNLSALYDRALLLKIFTSLNLPPTIRAEDLTLSNWKRITQQITRPL
jgi:16S rRNA (adenine1518-N6/adenine1519-N6)-dimethyltransferase